MTYERYMNRMGRFNGMGGSHSSDADPDCNTTTSDCSTEFALPPREAVLFFATISVFLVVVISCWSYYAGRSFRHLCLFCRRDSDASWCSYIRYYATCACCCYWCCSCCIRDEEHGVCEDSDGSSKGTCSSVFGKPTSRLYRNSIRRVLHRQSACAVCLEDFTASKTQVIYQTPCKHFFHSKCIRQWARSKIKTEIRDKGTCPVCREPFYVKDGVYSRVNQKMHVIWTVELPEEKPSISRDEEPGTEDNGVLCYDECTVDSGHSNPCSGVDSTTCYSNQGFTVELETTGTVSSDLLEFSSPSSVSQQNTREQQDRCVSDSDSDTIAVQVTAADCDDQADRSSDVQSFRGSSSSVNTVETVVLSSTEDVHDNTETVGATLTASVNVLNLRTQF